MAGVEENGGRARIFGEHKEWWNWKPVAALGVISDFAGEE